MLAARLWLETGPAWASGQAWWHSERRLRADQPAAGRGGHVPDAEIHWPSIPGSPYAGQVWAVEVELTPKPLARTTRIMGGLLTPMRYAQVIYLTAPAARPVVTRAAASLPPGDQPRVAVRDLPAVRVPARSRRDDRLVVAEADRGPVAAPQGGQGSAGGCWSFAIVIAAWPLTLVTVGRVRGGVVAGLARRPGCAGPPPGR